jgi:hypothetical protein
MKFLWLAATALVVLGLSPQGESQGIPQSGISESAISESNDAYHFLYWLGTTQPGSYTEWWYFNLYDSSNNVQAIFSYLVTNPASLPGGVSPLGISDMSVVAYTGGGIVTESDLYLAHAFSAAYNKANVQIGSNAIAVIDPDTYQIQGATRDSRILWNLTYRRTAPAWDAAVRFNVAPEPWELMSWLLYMPAAAVSGTLTVDGTSYNVSASGYHDHNWGEWELTGVPWNWAQYSQPGLSFDLGDFPNKPGGIASIAVDGQRYIFQSSQYRLTHTAWAYDSVHNLYYPTQSVFEADNGTARMTLTMTVQSTAELSAPLPASDPNAIIYEQTATYEGQVAIHGRSTSFTGNGFKEYTALTQ